MKLSKEKPAIYDRCHAAFGVEWDAGLIIAYGDTIHCKFDLGEQQLEHEKTHINQQRYEGVDNWWNKYFNDPQFRLSQEVEAYRNEYAWVKRHVNDRNRCYKLRYEMAKFLSGFMYGSLVSRDEAMRLIENK